MTSRLQNMIFENEKKTEVWDWKKWNTSRKRELFWRKLWQVTLIEQDKASAILEDKNIDFPQEYYQIHHLLQHLDKSRLIRKKRKKTI